MTHASEEPRDPGHAQRPERASARHKILAYVEARGGMLKRSSLDTLRAAVNLAASGGHDVAATILSGSARDVRAATDGLTRAYVVDAPGLDGSHLDLEVLALSEAVKHWEATLVLLAATPTGSEVAAGLAGELRTAVVAGVTEILQEGGRMVFRRPVYGGAATASVVVDRTPAIATLRAKGCPVEADAPPARASKTRGEVCELTLPRTAAAARVVERRRPEVRSPDLSEAEIVVAAGRGLRDPGAFGLVERLARRLGGAVAASRALCDAGWRPHAEQVGQTGRTVAPRLYIAAGISGSQQHLAGISGAGCVVAINTDPRAPIFRASDYGVVGDLHEVLPALERALATPGDNVNASGS